MADILKLSKRQDDLIKESGAPGSHSKNADNLHQTFQVLSLKSNPTGGPQQREVMSTHELLGDGSRMNKTINQVIEEKRLAAGSGFAEKFVNELYVASQINRGPPGAFKSSRLHLDMLLGRDERISPADYLNFDYNYC